MKNTILLIAAIVIGLSAKAQITLDHTFSYVSQFYSGQVIVFSSNGTKIMMNDTGTNQVKLYNTDYTLWKTINIPAAPTGYKWYGAVSTISDNLFNSDILVELVVTYSKYDGTTIPYYFYKSHIINETGTVILDLGNVNGVQVHDIDGSYKLYAEHWNFDTGAIQTTYTYDIYSLPGTMPCGQCGSLGVERTAGENRESLSGAVPNPNAGDATINYQLPVGVAQGTITIYNTGGQVMKTYLVGNNFTSINISSANLPSGVYYYNLSGPGITPMGNKMVVIK